MSLGKKYKFIKNDLVHQLVTRPIVAFHSGPRPAVYPVYLVGSAAMAYEMANVQKIISPPKPNDWDILFEVPADLNEFIIKIKKQLIYDDNTLSKSSTPEKITIMGVGPDRWGTVTITEKLSSKYSSKYGTASNLSYIIEFDHMDLGKICIDAFCPEQTIGEWLQTVPFAYDCVAVNFNNNAVLTTSDYYAAHNFEIKSRAVYKTKTNKERANRKGIGVIS